MSQEEEILAYLSRLTGARIGIEQPIRLSSVHSGAFAAWLKRSGVAYDAVKLRSGALSISSLLQEELKGPASPAAFPFAAASEISTGARSGLGIGIDVEEIDNIPEADDYREHPFYQENFTPTEIAHCITRADARLSFCGLWAAKEAVLKASGMEMRSEGLRAIEIGHHPDGRPFHLGGELSISHTRTTCVAVFLRLAAGDVPSANPVEPAFVASGGLGERRRRVLSIWQGFALAAFTFVLGVLAVRYGTL